MLKVNLQGGGDAVDARVSKEGALSVVAQPHPPTDDETLVIPFTAYLMNSAGSSAMNVNGLTTNVRFFISGNSQYDTYIKSVSVLIGDGGTPTLNEFGDLAALANGVSWSWSTKETGEVILNSGIKTNLDFVRTGFATGAIGTGTDSYLADVSGGASEKSYIPQIDIAQQFGAPWGLKLRKGTDDRFEFVVRDDLTGLSTFNILAYGIRL